MKKYLVYTALIMISLLGTDLTDFALSVWVLNQPGGAIKSYSVIWFFEAAPGVFLAPFIGGFVDRWSKKKMIIYGQLVAGIGSVVLMFLHFNGQLLPWHIMVVSGIGSIASMFVFSAFYVATTALVPKDKLMKAQGISTSIYAAISMGVPIAAPVLYKMIGMSSIFFIDAVTFLVSIGAFLIVRFVALPKSEEQFSLQNDLKVVKRFLQERKGIVHLFVFFFIGNFLMGLVQVLFTPLILDFSNEYVLGAVLSVVGIGAVVGGIVMGSGKSFKRPIRAILFINILVGIILSCLWIDTNPYVLAFGGMLIVLLFTVMEVINDAFFQTVVPVKMLGRLSGFEGLIVGGAAPLSFLFAGVLVDYLKKNLNYFSEEQLHYFPGTGITMSIMIIFSISGIFLILVSSLYSRYKPVKSLDILYNTEIKEEIKQKEKEAAIPEINHSEIY
ncbi:MFS transporter [Flavivirga jejuensis]|uniref:MFS transporter n=1 Tax=Flavivirga jejuensis TaxID=870487 RepID=A0ABT8WWH0_9FLAO|nr:MFS transporter [Flavivirga jejuensis]MDO5977231.1 MFS transporter [Flavivirga jejuensis]